jgi:hypothetical protein
MRNESSIEFIRWPYDDDDSWHVGIRAADPRYCVEKEFYAYPSELVELADRLSAFPVDRADEILFQAGSRDPSWAHWVFLRVFLVDVAGHAAVIVDVFRTRQGLTKHLIDEPRSDGSKRPSFRSESGC